MGNYVEKTKEHQYNLRDFALFLSVMKNPKAYRNVLSIIMEEPDIQLQEVKVEQVILNKSGNRAIRLDAWAKSTDLRQFNMEMQNEIYYCADRTATVTITERNFDPEDTLPSENHNQYSL